MAIVIRDTMQPSEIWDYDLDHSTSFPEGDNVASVVLSCVPAMTIPPSYAISGQIVKVWIYEGKTDGVKYVITAKVKSVDGRAKESEIHIKCKDTV